MTWFQVDDTLDQSPAGNRAERITVRTRPLLEDILGPLPQELTTGERRRAVWVVKQASGGNVRVLAERHRGIPRPDGTELRFYDGDEESERRVATFRAGSWYWCVAESALEPKLGDR